MRKILFGVLILAVVSSVFTVESLADDSSQNSKRTIRIAPAAPKFSVAERHSELASRRKKVGDAIADNSVLVMFSTDSKLYSNDVDYHYRQENNLYYLTALKQNRVTFVMTKLGGVVKEFVFLPKRNPQFETWNGKMYSNEDATEFSGIVTVVDARHQKGFLDALAKKEAFTSKDGTFASSFIPQNVYFLKGNKREYRKANDFADKLEGYSVRNALSIFDKLRLTKSRYETKLMQHAVDITGEALGRSMGMIGRANWEYEVQAEVEYTFRRRNADFWGYPSIVGCGPNATTLHYIESQGKVNKGDLMLMDVGAEYDHYTADVTRTFPVNGKFTKEQAEIYQIVYDAQEAAAAQLKPGATVGDAGRAAADVIKNGLAKLGLIESPDATYDVSFGGQNRKVAQYRMWYMHGWGHWLGMNVHDVGAYGAKLEPGMMMTNEPGIYLRGEALSYLSDTPANKAFIEKVRLVFEKYKNIGVRIEDDMVITADGVDWMTKDLPRTIEDVENFMAKASKEMRGYAVSNRAANPTFAVLDSHRVQNTIPTFGFLTAELFPGGKTIRSGWKHDSQSAHSH